eukprot:scaffold119602_cov19-Prasinocladus_malaysianus.AAC.1
MDDEPELEFLTCTVSEIIAIIKSLNSDGTRIARLGSIFRWTYTLKSIFRSLTKSLDAAHDASQIPR